MASVIVAPSALASTLRTSPTMTPRTLTSEASWSWLPAVSVFSVTVATEVNAFWYVATASPSSSARTTRNASPCTRRRTTAPRAELIVPARFRTRSAPRSPALPAMLPRTSFSARRSPRDPDGRRRAPDGQGQEQVDDVDRDDREADRPAHGEADARRAAAGDVAVVAVGQDDHDREDEHLEERPQHVMRGQEQIEVVVVGARRLPVSLGGDQPRREVAGQQPQHVERDDGDEAGDDARGHEERQRGHAHDLEGVDLLVDPHGADLRGEAAADRRRERQSGDERRDLTGVEVGREKARERRRAELVESGVALQADLGAGEEGEEGDDADGSADDRQRAAAEGDLGQEPHRLLLVALERPRGPAERAPVEPELLAEVVERAQRHAVDLLELPQADPDPVGGREQRHHCPFGGTSWK